MEKSSSHGLTALIWGKWAFSNGLQPPHWDAQLGLGVSERCTLSCQLNTPWYCLPWVRLATSLLWLETLWGMYVVLDLSHARVQDLMKGEHNSWSSASPNQCNQFSPLAGGHSSLEEGTGKSRGAKVPAAGNMWEWTYGVMVGSRCPAWAVALNSWTCSIFLLDCM